MVTKVTIPRVRWIKGRRFRVELVDGPTRPGVFIRIGERGYLFLAK